jgi:hypothetical protein
MDEIGPLCPLYVFKQFPDSNDQDLAVQSAEPVIKMSPGLIPSSSSWSMPPVSMPGLKTRGNTAFEWPWEKQMVKAILKVLICLQHTVKVLKQGSSSSSKSEVSNRHALAVLSYDEEKMAIPLLTSLKIRPP